MPICNCRECRHGSSPTWEYVEWFADQMEEKLEKNRHKGDRAGWLKCDIHDLFERLLKEVSELRDSLSEGDNAEDVVKECADVANFAMMVADKAKEIERESR